MKAGETNTCVGWKQNLEIWLKQDHFDSQKYTEKYWKRNQGKGVSDSIKGYKSDYLHSDYMSVWGPSVQTHFCTSDRHSEQV